MISDEIQSVLNWQTMYSENEPFTTTYLQPNTYSTGLPVYFVHSKWAHKFGNIVNGVGTTHVDIEPISGMVETVLRANVYDAVKVRTAANVVIQLKRLESPGVSTGPVLQSVLQIVRNHFPDVENNNFKIKEKFYVGSYGPKDGTFTISN